MVLSLESVQTYARDIINTVITNKGGADLIDMDGNPKHPALIITMPNKPPTLLELYRYRSAELLWQHTYKATGVYVPPSDPIGLGLRLTREKCRILGVPQKFAVPAAT